MILNSSHLFADGSKDLYPSGQTGYRAYLRASSAVTVNWPFPNNGTHYVYVKEGETITMASSAQGLGNAKIELYAPGATTAVMTSSTVGQILNRTAELAGPQLQGQSIAGKYTPMYYKVPVGGGGIYRVNFYARGSDTPSATVQANAAWSQLTNAGIMAWDVSVMNSAGTAFIPGRVYTNVLNLTNGTGSPNIDGFYGVVYVLTRDGYTYRVNNHGNNGMHFTFFVNNNGFNDATGASIYKSLNTTNNLTGKVHNPNLADTETQITHKLFYNLPANDLPVSATGAVPDNTTWLKNTVIVPEAENLHLTGVEGVDNQVSNKGGYVKFTAKNQSNYTIVIESNQTPPLFPSRTLRGIASLGENKILWDGKDGAGVALPDGTVPVRATVQLQGAEVHFPYFDMEYNRLGTIIEFLNHTALASGNISVVSDIIYWNDSDITNATNNGSKSNPINNSHLPPVNSVGISSNTNGHIWGINGTSTSGQFGDEKSIDTWTFITGEKKTIESDVVVKVSDLSISGMQADKTDVKPGEDITFTIKAKNLGPDDAVGSKFTFSLPEKGYVPKGSVVFSSSCGAVETSAINFDSVTNVYSSILNIPNGCEVTYTFVITANGLSGSGLQSFKAAILRPHDVTDPDATNPDPTVIPTDAQEECNNNGQGGVCNNIRNVSVNFSVCRIVANTAVAGLPVNHGITLMDRAGTAQSDQWPMIRKSAFTVIESNNKGFVPTRIAKENLGNILTPVEGMMVFDTTDKCLKIYDGIQWACFSVPSCP